MAKAKTNKSKISLAIVPQRKNGYRPHLIRRYGLAMLICVVIGLQFVYNGATTGNVMGIQSDITISSLLSQTNQSRAQAGRATLNINNKLVKAAYLKAQDMFDKQYWAHNAPNGTQPWKWFGDVGYNYDMAGENLARGFTSTGAVMTAWLNSPEHKANILKNGYQDVGFAIVSGELDGQSTSLVVALYGLSAESAVAGAQTSLAEVASTGQINPLTQFAVAIQSVTPATIGGLILLALAIIVAFSAHINRRKLTKSLRQSWYRHHGFYKMAGLMTFGMIVLLMYGGGQI